jgi:hypothetical protein
MMFSVSVSIVGFSLGIVSSENRRCELKRELEALALCVDTLAL